MGTDIFMYAERFQNRKWQFIGEMVEDERHKYDPEHKKLYRPKDIWDIRNYSLFAILADVRNSEGYECIIKRRGIPDDLSPEVKEEFESFLDDEPEGVWLPPDEAKRAIWIAHDNDDRLRPGWLTLEELIRFDWHGKRLKRYGMVDKRVAHLFHPERGFPFREWPEGIPCSYSRSYDGDPYCNARWTATYAEAVGTDFLEMVNTFAEKYGVTKDVRFVFWFE